MIPVDKNCVQKFDQYSQYLFSIQTYVETSHAILNILCFDFFSTTMKKLAFYLLYSLINYPVTFYSSRQRHKIPGLETKDFIIHNNSDNQSYRQILVTVLKLYSLESKGRLDHGHIGIRLQHQGGI